MGRVPRVLPSPDTGLVRIPVQFDLRKGSVELPDARVTWSVSSRRSSAGAMHGGGVELLDADAVGDRVTLRRWRSGDRYRPLGAPGRAKVGDIFTNRHVPIAERSVRWVMETEQGGLCWVEGLPPGHDFRIQDNTKRVIRWRWSRHLPPL